MLVKSALVFANASIVEPRRGVGVAVEGNESDPWVLGGTEVAAAVQSQKARDFPLPSPGKVEQHSQGTGMSVVFADDVDFASFRQTVESLSGGGQAETQFLATRGNFSVDCSGEAFPYFRGFSDDFRQGSFAVEGRRQWLVWRHEVFLQVHPVGFFLHFRWQVAPWEGFFFHIRSIDCGNGK